MDQREYAWNWFEYHAGQRLTTFRYYLVFIAAILVAVNTGVSNKHLLLIQAAAYFGAFISAVFLLLEIRNEQLVNVARDSLRAQEQDATFCATEATRLITQDRANRTTLLSYNIWLKVIYGVCLLGAIWLAIRPTMLVVAP